MCNKQSQLAKKIVARHVARKSCPYYLRLKDRLNDRDTQRAITREWLFVDYVITRFGCDLLKYMSALVDGTMKPDTTFSHVSSHL